MIRLAVRADAHVCNTDAASTDGHVRASARRCARRSFGRVATLLALAGIIATTRAAAQASLAITPSFNGSDWVPPATAIELRLSQPLQPSDGRLAVFIGATDLTALFTAQPEHLVYQPALLPLPTGASEVIVSLVSAADSWKEIARFPLHVRAASAFLKSEFGITSDMDLKGQVAEGHATPVGIPPRSEFQDMAAHIREHSAHVTARWGVRTLGDVLAITHKPEALRYRELGAAAPSVDLASYLFETDVGGSKVELGNVTFGSNRLLLGNFASRGITATQKLGPARLALAAMNATNIVGWDNAIGVSHSEHRLWAAELGMEAVPSRPGAFVAQLSVLDGSQLPVAGYNQGAVTEAEQSRGVGLHVSASDSAQRVRFDAGYARSEFTTPDDPLLSQGFALVPVPKATRNARYADVTVDVLRSLSVAPTVAANLVATYRHERVDPLYRSVANVSRADFLQNGVELMAGVGPVSAQGSYSSGRDNLDDVASLLEMVTQSTNANVAVPFAALMGKPASPWLPVLSYRYVAMHQFGDHLPPNGVFSLSDVPDQMSTNHALDVKWSGSTWHAGYQLSRTLQDNRQVGHETADLNTLTHALSLGVTPAPSFDVSLELALEDTRNAALSQEFRTNRASGLASWRLTHSTVLTAIGTVTRTADAAKTNEQTNTDVQLELSQRIAIKRVWKFQPAGQLFVRYSRRTADLTLPGVPATDPSRNWTLTTGVALSVF